MTNAYRFERVSKNCSDKDWENYFLMNKQCADEANIPFGFDSWEDLKLRSMVSLNAGGAVYFVWKNERGFGRFYLSSRYKTDAEQRFVFFEPKLVDSKLETGFLKEIFKAFLEFDPLAKFLHIVSSNGENDFLETTFQAEIKADVEKFELNIKDANHELIDQWLADAPSKFPKLRIQFYDYLPDDLLVEFSELFTFLLYDMPANSESGDLTITADSVKNRQELNRRHDRYAYRYLIFNEDNKIIAKTNVALNKDKPESMIQFMTGVLKEYRGIGLSKWLKAAMFKKLCEDFPTLEKINTETHPENHASRELSKKMGYQKTGFWKEFAIRRELVSAYLE